MIEINNIKELIGNHVAPYIYNSKHFQKGITPIMGKQSASSAANPDPLGILGKR